MTSSCRQAWSAFRRRMSGPAAVFIVCQLCLSTAVHAEQDAGGRAAFTRGGWAGARYVAMGKAAEAVADDVFAIYWNPAGLYELKARESASRDQLEKKIEKGDISDIDEKDLVRFSEEESSRQFFQIGVSAASLDIEREAGFAGAAFKLFKGIAGAGVYTIQSRGIEARDEFGNYIQKLSYSGSEGYLSYGWSTGVATMGVSLKGLREQIGESIYYGSGFDLGAAVDLLPFLRVGFVVKDLGTNIYNYRDEGSALERLDFGNPSMRLSIALVNVRDFTIAVSGVKKLEQQDYEMNAGLEYAVSRALTIYLGLNDSRFASGINLNFGRTAVSYAFCVDKVDLGYNNIVSITLIL